MKILVDMNLSPLWVPFLASHGFEVPHWSTVLQAWAPDTEIMGFAADDGYIVIRPVGDLRSKAANKELAKIGLSAVAIFGGS